MSKKTKFQEFYENPQVNEEGVQYVKSLSDEERHLILITFLDLDTDTVQYHIEFMRKFKHDIRYLRELNKTTDPAFFNYRRNLETKYLTEFSEELKCMIDIKNQKILRV